VARRGAVDLVNVSVEAGNGQGETLPVNALLVPGQPSQPLTFASGPISISHLSLAPRIRTQSRIDATVEIWAQY
jgi:hypothetical protein